MKKKIFMFMLAFLLFSGVPALANTYNIILNENGHTDIHNNYINKEDFKTVINIIFGKDEDYEFSGVGHATGFEFFSIMEKLGYADTIVANKEIYYNRALTYHSLYELLDWYFDKICEVHNIKSYIGKLSKGSLGGYTLTYGSGIAEEFEDFAFFKTKEDYLDVSVIVKNDKIIDVCQMEKDVPFSMLSYKREVKGKLYLLYDDGIIIESDGELIEFPVTEDFKFLNKAGDSIVLFVGNYKKNIDLAAVAVGRND